MTTIDDEKALNGEGDQKCSLCEYRSIAGLAQDKGKCPYHWYEYLYTKKLAIECYPQHPQAKQDSSH